MITKDQIQIGTKIRYPTWYWGKYIKWTGDMWVNQFNKEFPSRHIDLSLMELYDEQTHGWQNSSEFKGE